MKTMKWAALLAAILMLTALLSLTASAEEETKSLVVDDADLLTDFEEEQLKRRFERVSAELKCEIAVVTVTSTKGKTAQAFADDYYDENGYGYGVGNDGILLLIHLDIKDRKWAVSTYGLGHRALGDDSLDGLEDRVVPLLAEERYYRAFQLFAEGCEFYVNYEKNPDAVDENSVWMTYLDGGMHIGVMVLIALALGVIIALLIVSGMKAKLTTVRTCNQANAYVCRDGFRLTRSRDIYLYSTVTKIRRNTDSSSSGGAHRSSSGRIHGGRSGRF